MRTVVTGGKVFEGSEAPLASADVAFADGRIVDVGHGLDGDEAVDVSGCAVLPGMFDCHTHVLVSGFDLLNLLQTPFSYRFYEAAQNLERTLAVGITTVRDATGADLGVKMAVENGLIPGPRMRITVGAISQTGGHGDFWMPCGVSLELLNGNPTVPKPIVDGPDEMRRTVRHLVRSGADFIKVCTSGGVLSPNDDPHHAHFRDDELAVLMAEAQAGGIDVMSHAMSADGIKNAVRAGIRSIEHGVFLDDEGAAMMVERGTFLVPTLMALEGVLQSVAAGAAIPESSVRKARETVEVHFESFGRALAAGVKVAMGTDSGVNPHGLNLRELALMVKGGMSPEQALLAATRNAAELLHLQDELGTIEPGKRADLVVVEGDPFEFDTLPQRIVGVLKDGAWYRRPREKAA